MWRTAATLILTSPSKNLKLKPTKANRKTVHECYRSNYEVLMLLRSSKNKFFPSSYVFPGGGLDKADQTTEWMRVFNTDNITNNIDRSKCPMLIQQDDDLLPPDVSYRICAIRETFEETGLLIATQDKNDNKKKNEYSSVYKFKDASSADYWRKQVYKNAENFLQLCLELKCTPDIWSLHEWACWLTPTCALMRPTRRYDTVFYQAHIREFPTTDLQQDGVEISGLEIGAPSRFVEQLFGGKCKMGNPQIYELLRMLNFVEHQDLVKFNIGRSNFGIERYLPLIALTKEKIPVALYPGDDDYPMGMQQTGETPPIELDANFEQLNSEYSSRNYNRIVMGGYTDNGKGIIMSNCRMPYNHINPVDTNVLFNNSNL